MVTMIEPVEHPDATPRCELEEALTNLARYAARQMHHPDCGTWVRAHERIDALLDEWLVASA